MYSHGVVSRMNGQLCASLACHGRTCRISIHNIYVYAHDFLMTTDTNFLLVFSQPNPPREHIGNRVRRIMGEVS